MPRKLLLSEISDRVKNIHDGIMILDESTYVNNFTLAKFIDKDYGEWWAFPFRILKGTSRHPHRVRHILKNVRKVSIDEVLKRIKIIHNDNVQLKVETYVNTHTKAVFIDNKYGEWTAAPYSVMSGRGHPLGKLKKSIKTFKMFSSVNHWKTNEVCHVASGFEHAVLVWLNKNQYDFDWQIPIKTKLKTPILKKNAIYNVDLYIKSGPYKDTYVEIKGTWSRKLSSDGGKKKWLWFHENYPNSQLWMKSELINLGIIDSRRTYLKKARKINV